MRGDPMSPIIFNIALEAALDKLPAEVRARLGGTNIKYLACADDIVLVVTTRVGLTAALEILLEEAGRLGLEPGLQKCATLGIIGDRARKTWYQDIRPFWYQGTKIPVIKTGEVYRYLGIEEGADTRTNGKKAIGKLQNSLRNLQRAPPLKPQQKLWTLKRVAILRVLHMAINGRLRGHHLRDLDSEVLKFIKKALHLPKDTLNAALYASLEDGGMGVLNFKRCIPTEVKNKMDRLRKSNDPVVASIADRKHQECTACCLRRRIEIVGSTLCYS